MALSNFFRINLPYGIKKNSKNEWMAFNREYVPIGWKETTKISIHADDAFAENPIYTKYKGLTEKKLLEIAGKESCITRNDKNEIFMIYLYDDGNIPTSNKGDWNSYFEKIKKLSVLLK